MLRNPVCKKSYCGNGIGFKVCKLVYGLQAIATLGLAELLP